MRVSHFVITTVNIIYGVIIMKGKYLIYGIASILCIFSVASFAGSLNPPSYAVDGAGNPVPTNMTTSWKTTIANGLRFEEVYETTTATGTVFTAVLDHETGLIWRKGPTGAAQSYDPMACFGASTSTGRQGGWRIPTTAELTSLFARSVSADLFGLATTTNIWTTEGFVTIIYNSTSVPVPFTSITVRSLRSDSASTDKTGTARHWCIRGPK